MTLWKLRNVNVIGTSDAVRAVRDARERVDAPTLARIVETSLYVQDLRAARHFYAEVLGLEMLLTASRLIALRVGGLSVLLLFHRSAMEHATSPPHTVRSPRGIDSPQQLLFAIPSDAVNTWIERLQQHGIAIENRTSSAQGSESICIRDPDGHAVELVTPGLWSHD